MQPGKKGLNIPISHIITAFSKKITLISDFPHIYRIFINMTDVRPEGTSDTIQTLQVQKKTQIDLAQI